MENLDCRVTFRDIAHRNEPKAARLAGFAIHNQFDFRNSAERLKELPQCAFCHVKGKISDVKLHGDKRCNPIVSYRAAPEYRISSHQSGFPDARFTVPLNR